MTQTDLEEYLVGLGHTTAFEGTAQVWNSCKRRGFDLEFQPVSKLAIANDSLRMDIRNVADQVFGGLREELNRRKGLNEHSIGRG